MKQRTSREKHTQHYPLDRVFEGFYLSTLAFAIMFPTSLQLMGDNWVEHFKRRWPFDIGTIVIVGGFFLLTAVAGLGSYFFLKTWFMRAVHNLESCERREHAGLKLLIRLSFLFPPVLILLFPYLLKKLYLPLAVLLSEHDIKRINARKHIVHRLDAVYVLAFTLPIGPLTSLLNQSQVLSSEPASGRACQSYYLLVVIGVTWALLSSMSEITRMFKYSEKLGHQKCPRYGEPLNGKVPVCLMCGLDCDSRDEQQFGQEHRRKDPASHVED